MRSVLDGSKPEQKAFELALAAKQQMIECLYPALIDSARFASGKSTMKKEMRTLRASRLGFVRLDFASVEKVL